MSVPLAGKWEGERIQVSAERDCHALEDVDWIIRVDQELHKEFEIEKPKKSTWLQLDQCS